MKNVKNDSADKILEFSSEDERRMRENSVSIVSKMSPDDYLNFIQQYNEMLGHKQRRPAPIRGNFKL